MLARADLSTAVGFVAGTDEDTTNLSLVAAARRANPDLFVAARQNRPANAPLFRAMDIDSLLVPTEVVAREIYAQLSTPLLWRFLQEMPARGDDWAAEVIERLSGECGRPGELPHLWKVRLTEQEAPALTGWLQAAAARASATCCATPTGARSPSRRSPCWRCSEPPADAVGAARCPPARRHVACWCPATTTSWSPATSCCWPARPRPGAR